MKHIPLSKDLDQELSPSQIHYPTGKAVEEILNSMTHSIGIGLSIAGLVVLLVITGRNPDTLKYVSFTIYGVSQIILFTASALLHGFAPFPKARAHFERFDHGSIYLLIAGTYTPVTLVILQGAWGWSIFGVVWALALVGFSFKMWVMKKLPLIVDALYLPMGWLIAIAFRPFVEQSPPGFLLWAIIGGVSYSVGFIFYAMKKLPFAHLIWHFWVLAGSIAFYMGFALHIAPGW